MTKQNFMFIMLLVNNFLAFLGIGLIVPIMPTIMNEMQVSGSVVGYMFAAFAAAQFVSSPLTGRAVDRIGRKPVLISGLALFGASQLMFGMATSVVWLFAARILGGISSSMIMPSVTAFIADVTTKERRAQALGYMSASMNTGFIVGPGIGGLLAEFGTRVPFFVAGTLGIVAAILSLTVLREPEHTQETAASVAPGQSSWNRVFHPVYLIPLLIIFIMSFGLATFEGLFSLFLDHKHGFTPRDIAIAIAGSGIMGAFVQFFLFDGFTRRLGEIRVTRYSLLMTAVFVFLMIITRTYWAILFITFFVFVGVDMARPAITSYLSKVAGDEQGFISGMNSMFTSLGNILGPVVGGILFDLDWNYPYLLATVVIGIGWLLAIWWRQPKTE